MKVWVSLLMGSLTLGLLGCPSALAQAPPAQELQTLVQSDQLLLLRAEQITREGDVITCVGKVRAEYEGLLLDCHWLRYDRKRGRLEARRECLFSFGESYCAAEEIDFLLLENQAILRQVAGRGNDLGSNESYSEQPLFFWAEEMLWKPDFIQLSQASVTTCDKLPGKWDYRIVAERIDIYPRDRLEAFNTSVDYRGLRPATLPNLTFSLDPSRPLLQDYLPTVGYSALFGAFIRAAIPYNLDRRNLGKVHLQYYTRTGLAGGLEHRFNFGDRALGEIYYFQQGGVNNQAGRLDFRANSQFRLNENTVATFSYGQNRFELPNFTSPLLVSTQFGLTHQNGDFLAGISAGYSRSGDFTNTNYQAILQNDFSERTRLFLGVEYALASTLNERTQRYRYLGSLQHRADYGYWEAAFEKIAGQQTYFLNRSPELRFASRPLYLGEIPVIGSVSFADVQESPSQVRSKRWDLRVAVPDQMFTLGSSRLQVGAGFRQFFYDNSQKQRVAQARASWYQPLGESVTARADFNFQDVFGSTPFFHDLHRDYRVITGGLEYHNLGSLRLGAYAGYDLLNKRPHDLIGRVDFQPGPEFSISSGANFDPNEKRMRSVDNLLSLRLSDSISVTHWSLYDFAQQKLTYQDVMLNFESHDWIASIAYRGLQQEVFFQLNLKGFPATPVHVGPETGLPVLPSNLNNPFVR